MESILDAEAPEQIIWHTQVASGGLASTRTFSCDNGRKGSISSRNPAGQPQNLGKSGTTGNSAPLSRTRRMTTAARP
jgi:hypothetical protein